VFLSLKSKKYSLSLSLSRNCNEPVVCFLGSIFVSLSICVLALAEQAGVALKGRAVYFAFFDLLYTIFER
jgi:hypothetical protein